MAKYLAGWDTGNSLPWKEKEFDTFYGAREFLVTELSEIDDAGPAIREIRSHDDAPLEVRGPNGLTYWVIRLK